MYCGLQPPGVTARSVFCYCQPFTTAHAEPSPCHSERSEESEPVAVSRQILPPAHPELVEGCMLRAKSEWQSRDEPDISFYG